MQRGPNLVLESVLQGTIVNRTYGTNKNLPGIHFLVFTYYIFGPIYYAPPIIELFMSAQRSSEHCAAHFVSDVGIVR